MIILYVFRSLAYWGGIERILVDKMNYLASLYEEEAYMLTTDQGTRPIPYPLNSEVRIEDLNICFHRQYRFHGLMRCIVAWRKGRLFKKKMSEHLRMIKPDVIVCTTANFVDLNILAKTKRDVPLVVESHSIFQRTLIEGGLKRKYVNYMLRKGFKQASAIVTLTEKDALDWRKIHSCVKVIPNVVHLNEGRVSSLENHRVIWVGRFDYQKRPMEIIKIWKSVFAQHPNWQLDIYGEGEQRQILEETAGALSMNNHINPPTSSIFAQYRNGSILVSTSLFEPFGLVIPEAMSCRLPVVAYDCPFGPASIISDGTNGFLVEMNAHEMIIERLSMLMDDTSLRLEMGKAAKGSSSCYSIEIVMPLWKDLFYSILSKNHRRYENCICS